MDTNRTHSTGRIFIDANAPETAERHEEMHAEQRAALLSRYGLGLGISHAAAESLMQPGSGPWATPTKAEMRQANAWGSLS